MSLPAIATISTQVTFSPHVTCNTHSTFLHSAFSSAPKRKVKTTYLSCEPTTMISHLVFYAVVSPNKQQIEITWIKRFCLEQKRNFVSSSAVYWICFVGTITYYFYSFWNQHSICSQTKCWPLSLRASKQLLQWCSHVRDQSFSRLDMVFSFILNSCSGLDPDKADNYCQLE